MTDTALVTDQALIEQVLLEQAMIEQLQLEPIATEPTMHLHLAIAPRISWPVETNPGSEQRVLALRHATDAVNADFFPKLATALARLSGRPDFTFGEPVIDFEQAPAEPQFGVPRLFARVSVDVDLYNLPNDIVHAIEAADPYNDPTHHTCDQSLAWVVGLIGRVLLQSGVAATVRLTGPEATPAP